MNTIYYLQPPRKVMGEVQRSVWMSSTGDYVIHVDCLKGNLLLFPICLESQENPL